MNKACGVPESLKTNNRISELEGVAERRAKGKTKAYRDLARRERAS